MLEIIHRISLDFFNAASLLLGFEKCGDKIGIAFNNGIATINVFTLEEDFAPIDLFQSVAINHIYFAIANIIGDKLSLYYSQTLKLAYEIKDILITAYDIYNDRVYISSNSFLEVSVDGINIHKERIEDICFIKAISETSVIVIDKMHQLSIIRFHNTSYRLCNIELEGIPAKIFSDEERFFLLYSESVIIYSKENCAVHKKVNLDSVKSATIFKQSLICSCRTGVQLINL